MKFRLWQVAFVGTAVLALAQAPQLLMSSTPSQAALQNQGQPSATVMHVATGGANLRVRDTPDGEFVTCLEDKTPIAVTHYSSDRQWAFVASQQSETGRWTPVNGWVQMQYVASSRS